MLAKEVGDSLLAFEGFVVNKDGWSWHAGLNELFVVEFVLVVGISAKNVEEFGVEWAVFHHFERVSGMVVVDNSLNAHDISGKGEFVVNEIDEVSPYVTCFRLFEKLLCDWAVRNPAALAAGYRAWAHG